MAKLDEQARKIIASLEDKPNLLFAIMSIVHDEYMIAGPWTKNETTGHTEFYERCTPDGESIAQAAPVPNDPQKWQWQVKNGNSGETLTGAVGAQTLADGDLTILGWLLA